MSDPALDIFQTMLGRLRVSVTHACQLRCKFCHREGISSHWMPIHMQPSTFERVIQAFDQLGGREIDVTGGDPLVHPDIQLVLSHLQGVRAHRALCTNGLLLNRVAPQLEAGYIDEVKLSVHAASDSVGKELLGRAWSIDRLQSAIRMVRDLGVDVTMNFSVTSDNWQEFDSVLESSIEHDTNLLVIDLIGTRWDASQARLYNASTDPIIARLKNQGTFLETIKDRTGCQLRVFTSPSGRRWAVKDVRNGLLFTGMCQGCKVKSVCGEGVFVLRLDAEGKFRPCLLREDLERLYSIDDMDVPTLKEVMLYHIKEMMRVPFTFDPGTSIYAGLRHSSLSGPGSPRRGERT